MAVMNEVVTAEMAEIKGMISETYAKRDSLKKEMEIWYEKFPNKRYEALGELIITDSTLSRLDTHYKRLWDYHNAQSS